MAFNEKTMPSLDGIIFLEVMELIAEVIIDIENKQVNRSFDYLIPSHLNDVIKIGYRVIVPFGSLKRTGFVIDIKETTEYKNNLKEIIDTLDVRRVLNEEFIDLAKYIAENNFSFYATSLQTMIPTALKIKYQKVAKIINKDNVSDECKNIIKRGELIIDKLDKDKLAIIYNEVKKGNVLLDTKFKQNRNDNVVSYVRLLDSNIKASNQGTSLLSFLEEAGADIELSILVNDAGYSKSVIDTLVKNNAIEIYKKEVFIDKKEIVLADKEVNLTDEQLKVLNSLSYDNSKTYLLHGITGSGKTEVYMHWIDDVIKNNKSAIMLVPEIALTPQITALFKARFKSNIAILHSRLSIVDKYDEWKRIINNEVKIVVGARSAIFAPLNNLGIIIIDECHESSYIQSNNPKYNALDIAKIRSKTHSCPLVLGSATPNVSDYYLATNGEYELLELPNRVNGKSLPKSIVVDLRNELISGNKSVLSRELQEELKKCYNNKEQAILFLNRRGYSSFVMCRSCGESIKCPNCDVSLTYHSYTDTLKCHYCGHQIPNVKKCPSCSSSAIRFVGSGTEKILEAVNNLLPNAKTIRVDMDTTNKFDDYERAYSQFKNQEADILIGTQMITKGLDFENVTLVGVINADLALSYPTYDASMVAYNLIEQVSGRAGRANKDGKVIIQTYNPSHYVIECAKNHDYEKFYNKEILKRKISQMPPYSSVIEIMVSSSDYRLAYNEAIHITADLKKSAAKSIILGPTEAPIFKKNNIYRYTIQIQAIEDSVIERIKYIYPLYQNNNDIELSITRMC
ncbi:MAG: primosomal protein N' [Acholeplasmatales bacterium]|nr:primosomal protein N' [Acholeplasmatales bacterium]